MDTISIILSSLILLTAFVLVASKRVSAAISAMRMQGILIALNTGLIAVMAGRDDIRFDVLAVTAIIVALKVFYIPRRLHRVYAKVERQVSKDFFLNIPLMIMICCALVVFVYFVVRAAEPAEAKVPLLVNAISLTLIGLFYIISRKKAVGQIVGLLVIENGLFITAIYASDGMPFIVDMGIFADLVTAVLILGVMVGRISEAFESIDTDNLSNLRG